VSLCDKRLDSGMHVVAGAADVVGGCVSRDDLSNHCPHFISQFDSGDIAIGERASLHMEATELVGG
jgi:hypothetical protein